jgi:hypothetical protein
LVQIAKWESLLLEHGAAHVETLNRGRQPVAYSIKGFPEVRTAQTILRLCCWCERKCGDK